ncbi:RNA polymerase sigma factor [Chitinophaga silvatica]|uniref:RNA polymerase sigma factor n=1 Tax=Chitinophaga silvatica TaxID=2282649 RepID=A0A3E1YGW4_9BACT|nr:RNA polymerase sigma factor [Chitinophaga silvatica]RFS26665.1 RNA polymerase sigma factor [Chitinophaga silvatica]
MNPLALNIKNGNELAFREFFDKTYGKVYAYLLKSFNDNIHIDDIAQEVYVKLWQNRTNIDPEQSLEGYLFKILRNTVISHFRTLAKDKKHSAGYSKEVQYTYINQSANNSNTFNKISEKENKQFYEQVMSEISPLKQQCFRLHREYGLTYSQISQKEGIAVKTVEKYIRQTSRILQSKLLAKIQYILFYILLLFS